jgi:hypothetical protein
MMSMWFGEDQRANIIRHMLKKKVGLRLSIINNYHSTINIEHIGRT